MGSNPAGEWMFTLCVLYSTDKRQSQDSQDEEAVQMKYREQKKKKYIYIPVGARFSLGPTQSPVQWIPVHFRGSSSRVVALTFIASSRANFTFLP